MMTLLLTMALGVIFAAIIVPSITFDIKRDREEEMIHRGVQYSRAIRLYYKKFGNYPMKIEDLENTNQLRFLRKRYKDPLNCKNGKCQDFKLLHFGEAKMAMNAMGGGPIAGASMVGPNGQLTTNGGLSQTPTIGTTGAFGQNTQASTQTSSTDPTQQASGIGQLGSTDSTNSSSSSSGSPNTQFGGMPIVGVASLCKDTTIREFDKKKKYNEWQFVYDPTFDQGFLITTPYQPSLQMAGMQGTQNLNGPGQSGQTGTSGMTSGFGNSFGISPSPMQNNPASPSTGGFGSSNPPSSPSPPPQQQ